MELRDIINDYPKLKRLVGWIKQNLGNVTVINETVNILSYPVENSYVDNAAMFADQVNQTLSYFQYVIGTDTYYEYLGTTVGDITDYRELTADETTIIQGKTLPPVDNSYVDLATMYSAANQNKQRKDWIYRIEIDNTFYQYLGTRNGDATDYIQIGENTNLTENATVTGTYDINWSNGSTWLLTLIGNTILTESSLPATGTKVLTLYVSGNFTLTLPAAWDDNFTVIGTYDGLKNNQIVVERLKTGYYWVTITQDT